MRRNVVVQFIVSNLGWMLASILLAVMIWVAANMASDPVVQDQLDQVPVQFNLPDGFVVTAQPDNSTVTAVIRTTRSQWDLMVADDVLVTADLTHYTQPGTYRVELNAVIAKPMRGKVVALRPSVWSVTIDREVEQRLPIQVVVTNDPPLGYTYPANLTCSDTEVTVQGSADKVAAVDRVEARLNLSDDVNPTTKTVNLTPVQSNDLRASSVTLTPTSVTCQVDIQPRTDVFQMPVLPKVVGSPPPGYDFKGYSNIDPDTVALTGDRAAIRSLPGLIRTVAIDLTDRTETFTIEVALDLPIGVTSVPENQLIKVTVSIEPQLTTRPFEDVPVEVVGLDTTQFAATGLADTVTVFVSGPPGQLPTQADVRVIVDLTGLQPGVHQVQPQGLINDAAPSGETSISISPDTLSVTIEALNPTPTPPATATSPPPPPPVTLTPTPTTSPEG
jgi:YbbR domain-containing protein